MQNFHRGDAWMMAPRSLPVPACQRWTSCSAQLDEILSSLNPPATISAEFGGAIAPGLLLPVG
jgi:hypothetical protein